MLGYRGVSRDIHDWEIESFKAGPLKHGAHNLQLMLPSCARWRQARAMRGYLDTVHNLRSGEDGLKIILMSERSGWRHGGGSSREFDGYHRPATRWPTTTTLALTLYDRKTRRGLGDSGDHLLGQKFGKRSASAARAWRTAKCCAASWPSAASPPPPSCPIPTARAGTSRPPKPCEDLGFRQQSGLANSTRPSWSSA